MKPEVYFLRYAFPCSDGKLQRNEITQPEFDTLEDAVVKSRPLSRDFLERVFAEAHSHLQNVATELREEVWSVPVIREYFLVRHNQIIDAGLGTYQALSPVLKEHCKVRQGVLESFLPSNFFRIRLDERQVVVCGIYLQHARIGDSVLIHRGYAIELLPQRT